MLLVNVTIVTPHIPSHTHPGVESGVGETFPTSSGVRWSVDGQLVLAFGGIDEVVGGVPGSTSELSNSAEETING